MTGPLRRRASGVIVRSSLVGLVDAEVELACIELATGRPRLLPDDLRDRLSTS